MSAGKKVYYIDQNIKNAEIYQKYNLEHYTTQ